MVVGKVGENAQYFIYCEKSQLFESKHFLQAIFDLFSVYFIFDISYPKTISSILLFFQCFVFNINKSDCKKKLPDPLAKLLQLIESILP